MFIVWNSSQAELGCLGALPVHFHLLFDLNPLGRASFGGSCDTLVLSSVPVKCKMNHKLMQPTIKMCDLSSVSLVVSQKMNYFNIYFSIIICSGIFIVQCLPFQTIQFTKGRLTTGFVLLPGVNICSFFFTNNGFGYVLAFFSPRVV